MHWKMRIGKLRLAVALLFVWVTVAMTPGVSAQSLADFEKKVTELTLKNGLKFLILERHEAPVVSFHTYADVGSVDEVKGITGMAHVFEHMAFKGSRTIGTTDYQSEVKVLAELDDLFLALKEERAKQDGAGPGASGRVTTTLRGGSRGGLTVPGAR